ncbi:MAG: DUF4214 domain-containing protein [Clostridia bacterium]|nr:DUF4214 domain-containing protein [Clostridia bacterium]
MGQEVCATDNLNSGVDRGEVFAGFTNSPEFINLCAEYQITA